MNDPEPLALQVVADEQMPGVEAIGARWPGVRVTLRRKPGRQLSAADVAEADVLLVRSVTRVNADLLAGSRVRFVGTATIGTDHLDIPWLASRGIAWSAAPGCNARAVAEWVLASLLRLAAHHGEAWPTRRLGIVGLGHVGSALARLAEAAGLTVACSDPLRTVPPPDLRHLPNLALDDLLAISDVVSVHVPLTHTGPAPTRDLLDRVRLARLRPGAWLINAARGEVIPSQDLAVTLATRSLSTALDVWCGEPLPDPGLVDAVWQASPHIAGHSLEGKWRGTWQVMQALADHVGKPLTGHLEDILPEAGRQTLTVPVPGSGPDAARLATVLDAVVPLRADDAALRAAVRASAPDLAFDALRRDYAVRREFPAHAVRLDAGDPLRPLLEALGFRVLTT